MTTPSKVVSRFSAVAMAARSKRYAPRRTQDTSTRTTVEIQAPSLSAARRKACSARRTCSSSSLTSSRTTTFVSNAATPARTVRDGLLHVSKRHRPDSGRWHEPGGEELVHRELRPRRVLAWLHAKNDDLRLPGRKIARQHHAYFVGVGDSNPGSVLSHGDIPSLPRSRPERHVNRRKADFPAFPEPSRDRESVPHSARGATNAIGRFGAARRPQLSTVQPVEDCSPESRMKGQPLLPRRLFERLPDDPGEAHRARLRFPDLSKLPRPSTANLDLDALPRDPRRVGIRSELRRREIDLGNLAQRGLARARAAPFLLHPTRGGHCLSVLHYLIDDGIRRCHLARFLRHARRDSNPRPVD